MTSNSVQPSEEGEVRALSASGEDAECIRELATLFIDVVRPFSEAMARHLHEQDSRLGELDDEQALEATRASCASNIQEILSMIRADIPVSAMETPVKALDYARYQRRRGAGYGAVTSAYQYGVAMFRDVVGLELNERLEESQRGEAAQVLDDFLFTYIRAILERLAREFDVDPEWEPNPDDEILENEASEEAAKQFRDAQLENGEWLPEKPDDSRAHSESEKVLDEFIATIEEAAEDEELSSRLALADTTVTFILADEDDLHATLLLDRDPIEVSREDDDGEISLRIASFDLAQLCSGDLKLAMSVARGRVLAEGPVRKFLRVAPVVGTLEDRVRENHEDESEDEDEDEKGEREDEEETSGEHDGAQDDSRISVEQGSKQSGLSTEQQGMLDDAAEFEYHHGALTVEESNPGDFWSVECVDLYKAFGKNRVLAGLNLGVPEGMITVILGPSGTGKSVLINHLIGLMFPDQGDILVHGRSVPGRRRSELFEMRRKFGILFQDGALFGSMNVYDNVAFPLREQTNKSETEIGEIVEMRLEEVGLLEAKDLMPSEISGGMKKRAGFARALVMEPEIVMFDEPDSGLDPVRTALLCDLIRKVHGEHGGTYIVITHDIASARRLGDYIAVLWKGRIVESGDAQGMFSSENPFVRQFLAGIGEGPLGME